MVWADSVKGPIVDYRSGFGLGMMPRLRSCLVFARHEESHPLHPERRRRVSEDEG